jgi:DNA-binding NarL/FixJ family response regulator
MAAGTAKSLVEIAYRLEESEEACIVEMARAVAGVFDRRHPSAAFVTRLNKSDQFELNAMWSPDGNLATALKRTVEWLPSRTQREMSLGPPVVSTSSRVFGSAQMKKLAKATGVPEFAGLICPTGAGVLVVGSSRAEPLRSGNLRRWLPAAAHLSSAWRLRHAMCGSDNQISFSSDGRLIDDGAERLPTSVRALLRRAVLLREKLRAQKGEELWPALIDGQWTLVDRFEAGGRRLVVACRNVPRCATSLGLNDTQALALGRAITGEANKRIAIDLQVSEATVSRMIARSLKRLRLFSLSEAAEFRAMDASVMSVGHEPTSVDVAVLSRSSGERSLARVDGFGKLTSAERTIIAAVLDGLAREVIAERRATSPHTITNQLASIYGKLGVGSRRDLVARLHGVG